MRQFFFVFLFSQSHFNTLKKCSLLCLDIVCLWNYEVTRVMLNLSRDTHGLNENHLLNDNLKIGVWSYGYASRCLYVRENVEENRILNKWIWEHEMIGSNNSFVLYILVVVGCISIYNAILRYCLRPWWYCYFLEIPQLLQVGSCWMNEWCMVIENPGKMCCWNDQGHRVSNQDFGDQHIGPMIILVSSRNYRGRLYGVFKWQM